MTSLNFNTITHGIGDVGVRMTAIDAAEGAAGNISVFVRSLDALDPSFREHHALDLPIRVPAIAGGWVIVTGAGRRLRDVATSPSTTLCCLQIHSGGARATLYAGTDIRPTSELNSHLAIHNDQVTRRGLTYHAVVHAQPPYLTYLSHIARYADHMTFNRRLLRWQPETIIEFPQGIATLPFQIPASREQSDVTSAAMQVHRAVVWQQHGIVTRADADVRKAGDLIEYAETAARYEYLNLQAGESSSGLSDAQVRDFCECWGIEQPFF